MARTFDKQVLLDITVNLVPMAVLIGFLAMILVFDPWTDLSLIGGIQQYLLIVIPLLALAWITKRSVEAIEASDTPVEPAGVGHEDDSDDRPADQQTPAASTTPATDGIRDDAPGAGSRPGREADRSVDAAEGTPR